MKTTTSTKKSSPVGGPGRNAVLASPSRVAGQKKGDPVPEELRDCHDCGAKPGQIHRGGCDTERCSVCGGQRLGCGCKGHDKAFARWTGLWPGSAECAALGISLNDMYGKGLHETFFVKPSTRGNPTGR